MKILYYCDSVNYGGAERYLIDIANAMCDYGHDVAVIINPKLFEFINKFNRFRKGVKVFGVNVKSNVTDLFLLCQMKEILSKFKPDIVHINQTWVYSGLIWSVINYPVKIVSTIHALEKPKSKYPFVNWFRIFLGKMIIKKCSKIITFSETLREIYSKSYGVPLKKIEVIPNGIDKKMICEEFDDTDKKVGEIPLIGVVSRLSRGKGIDVLIAALKILKERGIKFKCQVIGDGDLMLKFKKETENIRLPVDFLGFKEDVFEYVKNFSVAVCPSDFESFPYVILEYMECACAIVATKVGGIPDMVSDGKEALLVPPKDPVAMANAIMKCLTNLELANRMAIMAREKRRKRFSMGRCFRKTSETYKEVLLGNNCYL